jgi:hypothetical protein
MRSVMMIKGRSFDIHRELGSSYTFDWNNFRIIIEKLNKINNYYKQSINKNEYIILMLNKKIALIKFP